MRIPSIIAFAALGSSVAYADGANDEVSAGSAPQTATSPQTTWTTDKLGAIWDASEQWQVRLDLAATHDYGTKPATSTSYGDSGGNILLANLSAEFDPDTHWMFKLVAGGSPSSTTYTPTSIQAAALDTSSAADAQLKSKSSSVSTAGWIGYDTGGDGNFETAATFTATATQFATDQQITTAVDKAGQMLTQTQLRSLCATHMCSRELAAALKAQAATLDQLVLDGNVSEQLYKNTDLGVDAAYYVYNKDPTQVGYFSVATAGRTSSFGGGMAIAPLQYTVAPDLIHRWGQLMAMTSLSYGKYVGPDGYDVTASLRVQYRFKLDAERRLKLWGKIIGSRDVDQTSAITRSASLAVGAQYTW